MSPDDKFILWMLGIMASPLIVMIVVFAYYGTKGGCG